MTYRVSYVAMMAALDSADIVGVQQGVLWGCMIGLLRRPFLKYQRNVNHRGSAVRHISGPVRHFRELA